MSQRILYISYDGMLEPLGQSQVVAYLEKLAPGRKIHLISFEKREDWNDREQREAVRQRIAGAGISWHPLRYHKRPTAPATAYDIAAGSALAIALALRHRIQIVHVRSYVAGLMGLAAKRASGARLLFDMRGFWADERVDGNLWPPDGLLYRGAKSVERRLLLAADHVVTLTHASAIELGKFPYLEGRMPPVSVIPTCADLDRFRPMADSVSRPFTFGYVGSVGTRYLLEDVLGCYLAIRRLEPDARMVIANRGQHDTIRSAASCLHVEPGALDVVSATRDQMPGIIQGFDAAAALYKPAFSALACAPTKLAEYLGCGVPCLGNAGVGDVEELFEERKVGVAVSGFSDEEMTASARQLIALTREPDIQHRCRTAALELFSLPAGVGAYEGIYREMIEREDRAA
ncbi:MAG: glycosyltransferase [Pseudomonadota bacterium]